MMYRFSAEGCIRHRHPPSQSHWRATPFGKQAPQMDFNARQGQHCAPEHRACQTQRRNTQVTFTHGLITWLFSPFPKRPDQFQKSIFVLIYPGEKKIPHLQPGAHYYSWRCQTSVCSQHAIKTHWGNPSPISPSLIWAPGKQWAVADETTQESNLSWSLSATICINCWKFLKTLAAFWGVLWTTKQDFHSPPTSFVFIPGRVTGMHANL